MYEEENGIIIIFYSQFTSDVNESIWRNERCAGNNRTDQFAEFYLGLVVSVMMVFVYCLVVWKENSFSGGRMI